MKKRDISIETTNKLANMLYYCGKQEMKIEKYRQILCKNKQFEPYASF